MSYYAPRCILGEQKKGDGCLTAVWLCVDVLGYQRMSSNQVSWKAELSGSLFCSAIVKLLITTRSVQRDTKGLRERKLLRGGIAFTAESTSCVGECRSQVAEPKGSLTEWQERGYGWGSENTRPPSQRDQKAGHTQTKAGFGWLGPYSNSTKTAFSLSLFINKPI